MQIPRKEFRLRGSKDRVCLKKSKASVAGEAYVWGRVVAEISSGGLIVRRLRGRS